VSPADGVWLTRAAASFLVVLVAAGAGAGVAFGAPQPHHPAGGVKQLWSEFPLAPRVEPVPSRPAGTSRAPTRQGNTSSPASNGDTPSPLVEVFGGVGALVVVLLGAFAWRRSKWGGVRHAESVALPAPAPESETAEPIESRAQAASLAAEDPVTSVLAGAEATVERLRREAEAEAERIRRHAVADAEAQENARLLVPLGESDERRDL
jgi:hypothetical protein